MQLTSRTNRRYRSIAERLARVTSLRHCDPDELERLARDVDSRDVSAGTVLCRAGDPAEETFFIESGALAVVRGDRTVATLRDGDIAGELAPLGATVRTADLVARTDCVLFVVPSGRVSTLLADSIGFRRGLTRLLADRTEELRQLAAAEETAVGR